MRKSLKGNNISILESKAQLGRPPTIHRTFDTMAWPRSVTWSPLLKSLPLHHPASLPPRLWVGLANKGATRSSSAISHNELSYICSVARTEDDSNWYE